MPSKPLVIPASFVVEMDFQARSFAVKWVVLAFFRDEVAVDFAFRFATVEAMFKWELGVFQSRLVVVVSYFNIWALVKSYVHCCTLSPA